MTHLTIVSDDSGVGKLFLSKFIQRTEDLSGHSFFVADEELWIGKDNIVTIPSELMKRIGYHRKDGRYALPIQLSYRHVNGELVAGGGIIRTPHIGKYLEEIKDGKTLPKKAIVEDPENLEVLVPADIPEWTQSGDD